MGQKQVVQEHYLHTFVDSLQKAFKSGLHINYDNGAMSIAQERGYATYTQMLDTEPSGNTVKALESINPVVGWNNTHTIRRLSETIYKAVQNGMEVDIGGTQYVRTARYQVLLKSVSVGSDEQEQYDDAPTEQKRRGRKPKQQEVDVNVTE